MEWCKRTWRKLVTNETRYHKNAQKCTKFNFNSIANLMAGWKLQHTKQHLHKALAPTANQLVWVLTIVNGGIQMGPNSWPTRCSQSKGENCLSAPDDLFAYRRCRPASSNVARALIGIRRAKRIANNSFEVRAKKLLPSLALDKLKVESVC